MIPIKRDPTAKVEKVVEHVPIEKVVKDLESIAPLTTTTIKDTPKNDNVDVTIPPPAPETYPLKKMAPTPEVLLVSYSDIKAVMQDKIGFRCDDVKMEEMGVAAIKKAL
jgi:hypothetical protein